MKRKGFRISAFCLAASMLLSGCGEAVYELTPEEQAAVVAYSSHCVTKFNKNQSEGLVNVAAYKAMLEAKEAEKKEREEARKKEEEAAKQAEEKQESGTAGSQTGGSGQQESVSYVSLNQALKLGGIDVVYRNYKLSDSYKETESYMVTANSGNELLAVTFSLKNSGNKKASCNILKKMPVFRLTVNGSESASADTTILLNDLGTYQGTIEPGASRKAVLLFQFPKGKIKKVKSMDLEITVNGDKSTVQLLSAS